MIDRQFKCPRCGDNKFGTDIPNRVRHCHGQTYELARDLLDQGLLYRVEACKFTWPDVDDWKYETLIVRCERADDPIVDVTRKTAIACSLAPPAPQPDDAVTLLHSLLEHRWFRGGFFAVQFLDVKTARLYRTAITDSKRPWVWVKMDDGWQQVQGASPWTFESYCEASLVPIEEWQRPISTGGRA